MKFATVTGAWVSYSLQVSLPIVVSITRGGQRLFHAALDGTSPDNDDWVERKSRVVHRFGHSSLYMGTKARAASSTFEERSGLDPARYAAALPQKWITDPQGHFLFCLTPKKVADWHRRIW